MRPSHSPLAGMVPKEQVRFLFRLLRLFGRGGLRPDQIRWVCHGDNAPVRFFLDGNGAGPEGPRAMEITPDNIETLEQCVAAIGRIAPDWGHAAAWLFRCRLRGQRPRRDLYRRLPPEIRGLFDACGPAEMQEEVAA